MKKTRRKFSVAFKTKVVLEVLKERATVSELAARFNLHPTQINTWKREFISNASKAFDPGQDQEKEHKQEKDQLLKIIGEQKVAIDFLKRALS